MRLPTKRRRRYAEVTPNLAGEVALVGKADRARDIAYGVVA